MNQFIVCIQNEPAPSHQVDLSENDTLCLSEASPPKKLIFIKDTNNEVCVRLETGSDVCLNRNGRTMKLTPGKPCRVLPDDVITFDDSRYRLTRITNKPSIKRRASSFLTSFLAPLFAACTPATNSTDQNASPDAPAVDTPSSVDLNAHPGIVDNTRHTDQLPKDDEPRGMQVFVDTQEMGRMLAPSDSKANDTTNPTPTDAANHAQPEIDTSKTDSNKKNVKPKSVGYSHERGKYLIDSDE